MCTLYYYVYVCFCCTSRNGIFFSSGGGSFLELSAPGHARNPPEHQALADVRGTCSRGSKWQVTTGKHSEHVEPSRPMQTHVQVKKGHWPTTGTPGPFGVQAGTFENQVKNAPHEPCHWSKAHCTWFWPDTAQVHPSLFTLLDLQLFFVVF